MTTYAHTYAVQHPQMSEALLIDSHVERTEQALKAHATMYVLRHFDEMLEQEDFIVSEVLPGSTSIDLFA